MYDIIAAWGNLLKHFLLTAATVDLISYKIQFLLEVLMCDSASD